ncbi:MAG TPA: ABC transporter permease [Rhodothermales bacterium]|nr:ABC transporter permease [Rhodothermales bacterium]
MFTTYFTPMLRNLRKQGGYTSINVAGLSLGVACSLLIFLFVRDELSFDRFHEQADLIYRIVTKNTSGGQDSEYLMAPVNMGEHLVAELPDVVGATKIRQYGATLFTQGNEPFYETGGLGADRHFFEVFSFPLVQGNPQTALAQPKSVVLCEHLVAKYFDGEDPVGQTVKLGTSGTEYTVTGVVAEVPQNSHFRFHILYSFDPEALFGSPDSWLGGAYPTYIVLKEGAQPAAVEAAIADLREKYLTPKAMEKVSYRLQPLTHIHLHSHLAGSELGENGDMRYIYLFSTIALLVLLIACINYMNLATARAAQRAMEVGVRKTLGASRGDLIRRFMGESLLISAIAVVAGVALVELILPVFNAFVERDISISYLGAGAMLPLLAGLVLAVGLVAGSYPAFALSSFRPVSVLKGRRLAGPRGRWLREGLVVFQFAVSVFLLVATVVVFQQLDFVRTSRLGFDKEHVVMIQTRGALAEAYDAFTAALASLAEVQGVSTTHVPGMAMTGPVYVEGADLDGEGQRTSMAAVDPAFVQTMDIDLAAGRDFNPAIATDAQTAILVNETAAREFGWKEPVGKTLRFGKEGAELSVIGVVKDYHFLSLKEAITPLILRVDPENYVYNNVIVRTSGANLPATLASLEDTWQQFVPGRPFDYQFMDEAFDRYYRAEERLGRIFGYFALLAVFIACLGLFGLASYTAEQRTKEIGVRKVLGASTTNIVVLLTKNFARLVLVAFVLAAPLAYLGMNRWLEDFAYRIDVSWQLLALTGLVAFGIASLTVSYHAMRAAWNDPVKSLRYE